MDKILKTEQYRLLFNSGRSSRSDCNDSLTTNEKSSSLSSSSSLISSTRTLSRPPAASTVPINSSNYAIPQYLIQPNLVYGQPAFLHAQHQMNLNPTRNYQSSSYQNPVFLGNSNTTLSSQASTHSHTNPSSLLLPPSTNLNPFQNHLIHDSNNIVAFDQSSMLRMQINDSRNIVPSSLENDDIDPSNKNRRSYKNYFKEIYEDRTEYLMRVPSLLYDNLNAGDFSAIHRIIIDVCLPCVEIETLGPTTIKSGHANVFNYFITLLDVAPDLIVMTDKPKLVNDRVIALNIHMYGTKIDYGSNYLDNHIKYYMEQMSSGSSSATNYLSEGAIMKNFVSGHNKRTYREFVTEEKQVCFNIHFTVHLVLNSSLTHVVKFIKLLKSVKLSVPRQSFV